MRMVLIDRIGIYSGMNHYIDAFISELKKRKYETKIISNYQGKQSILKNYYIGGNILEKIYLFIISYIAYIVQIIKLRKNNYFITSFYGEVQDVIFLIPFLFFSKKKIILDVHELVGLDIKNKIKSRAIIFFVKLISGKIIYHSSRTEGIIENIKYSGEIYYCPHLKYIYSKEYDLKNIKKEIEELINKDKINFLFFGNIRESKGIDLLFEVINKLEDQYLLKSNFIIAGKDPENLLISYSDIKNIKKITRYVTDEEANYLYSNVDYILLPYKEISQSGVLETAIYFKKKSICSNINYFREIMKKYKSFGFLFNSAEEFLYTLQSLCIEKKEEIDNGDYNNYLKKEEIDQFFYQLNKSLIL